jgi:N6-adenosine-specific RNA methylase IME4
VTDGELFNADFQPPCCEALRESPAPRAPVLPVAEHHDIRCTDLLGVTVEYKTIVADPPWAETGGGKICRGAQKHYKVVKDSEMLGVIRSAPCWTPAADCHLWLWVTNNRLPLGLDIMAKLGFRYITNLVWVKDRFGIGQYLRGQHELCLLGVRGKAMMPPIRNVPSVLSAKRGEHSTKPSEAFAVFDRVSPTSPRLEMFARQNRSGWTTWGDELVTPNAEICHADPTSGVESKR